MDDLALPLTQSEAFERTCAVLNVPVQRFDSAAGTCLVQSRKLPLLGPFHLASRGPVFREGADDPAWASAIKRALRGPLFVNAPLQAEGRGGPIGGWRLLGGAELAQVDLTEAVKMRGALHQKWRNQLKKAESGPLRVIDQPLDARKHAWFFEAEREQQKSRGYRAYPAAFLLAYAAANKGQARLYTALLGGQPVAAMLILKHGRMATYQAGVTRAEGRKHCAHNLLLWRAMTDLNRKQYAVLDLGRADLSEGLRRFKSGTGARIQTLPGTYLLHSWVPGASRKPASPRPIISAQ
ncbi:MAG: GNAT family N-acetyltransferase [Pseudomonadota bacterium]